MGPLPMRGIEEETKGDREMVLQRVRAAQKGEQNLLIELVFSIVNEINLIILQFSSVLFFFSENFIFSFQY